MKNIKKNILYNSAYQIFLIILPIITSPYVSRVLGAENIGVFSFSQALANYFYLVAMLGVKNYGNRTIATVRDDPIELRKNFWEIYYFQVLFGIIIAAIYVVYVSARIHNNRSIYYFQLFYILSGVFDLTWCYFGLEEFKTTASISMFIKVVDVLAIFTFVKNGMHLNMYTFLICIAMFANQVVLMPYIFKKIPFQRPTISGVIRHIKPNLVLFIPVLAVSFYNIMDKLMLGMISTKKEVGFYTYSENITQIPNTIILSVNNAVMPRMSNLAKSGEKEQSTRLINALMIIAMIISVGCAFGLACVSPILIPWFYGEDFKRCVIFVALLTPIIIFKGWAGVIRTQYIIPNKKDKVFIVSLFTGAIVNLIINAALIPYLAGIGAVIGTVCAELSVCVVQFGMVRKEISFQVYLKDGLAFVICGLIMSLFVLSLYWLNCNNLMTLFLQVIIGILVYGLLSLIYLVKIKKT